MLDLQDKKIFKKVLERLRREKKISMTVEKCIVKMNRDYEPSTLEELLNLIEGCLLDTTEGDTDHSEKCLSELGNIVEELEKELQKVKNINNKLNKNLSNKGNKDNSNTKIPPIR